MQSIAAQVSESNHAACSQSPPRFRKPPSTALARLCAALRLAFLLVAGASFTAAISLPATAASSVPATGMSCINSWNIQHNPTPASTPQASCADLVNSYTNNEKTNPNGCSPSTYKLVSCNLVPGTAFTNSFGFSISSFSPVMSYSTANCGSGISTMGAVSCYGNTSNCPANSTWDGGSFSCLCNAGYTPDAQGKLCEPKATCPITPLPETPPPFDDKCAQSLEDGRGVDVAGTCPKLDAKLTGSNGQMQCVADKIHALGLAYTGPSATIRNEPYQKHMLAVWKKWIDINKKVTTPEQKQACATIIAAVDKEMNRHHIRFGPSGSGNQAPHVLGRAFDIPEGTVNAMMDKVLVIRINNLLSFQLPYINIRSKMWPFDVQDYVNSSVINPPACNLHWGGRFKPKADNVHFQLP